MKKIEFQAMDYTEEDQFQKADYSFLGDEDSGWQILRNGKEYLRLDPGYIALKTKSCGICSTDIDRRFLPFPLPQIIGHEIIAEDPETQQKYVVEINDSFQARGSSQSDAFIQSGIPTHSPERKVLGIDRLPGGFGSYILAPKNSVIPYSDLPDKVAVLIEPFSAALQAVIASPPQNGDEVAVLGPRRLGSLIIAALHAYRLNSGKDFSITALARRDELLELSKKLGADHGINVKDPSTRKSLARKFSIVYDTTASPEGFLSALEMADREVHLKTTNGQIMAGLNHLTELVVDELSILPFGTDWLNFAWENENPPRKNTEIYVSPELSAQNREFFSDIKNFSSSNPETKIHSCRIEEACRILESDEFSKRLPRFDICIVSNFSEIEKCIRPREGSETSLVRPRGVIYYIPEVDGEKSTLNDFFLHGGSIRSSRCGDFHYALKILKENPSVVKALNENMISHEYSVQDLEEAYLMAKSPNAIKVMVNHE